MEISAGVKKPVKDPHARVFLMCSTRGNLSGNSKANPIPCILAMESTTFTAFFIFFIRAFVLTFPFHFFLSFFFHQNSTFLELEKRLLRLELTLQIPNAEGFTERISKTTTLLAPNLDTTNLNFTPRKIFAEFSLKLDL